MPYGSNQYVQEFRGNNPASKRNHWPATKEDYILAPTVHAAEIKDKAPELAVLLQHSAVEITARQYSSRDQEALASQKVFRQVSTGPTCRLFSPPA